MRIAHAVLLACVVLVGCSDPHREPMPTDLQHADEASSFKAAVAKLPEDERQLLAGYMMRASLALPPDERAKTVGEAIEAQRKFVAFRAEEEKAAQKRAEEEERKTADALKNMDDKRATDRDAMRGAASIEVLDVSLPTDPAKKEFGNELVVTVRVKNTGKNGLKKVAGWLDAKDGARTVRTIATANIDGPIAPGETREWKGRVPISAPRTPVFSPTSAAWEPWTYTLDDGTEMRWPR